MKYLLCVFVLFLALMGTPAQAQCDWQNFAIVNVSFTTPSGVQSYAIYDWSDYFCKRHFNVSYIDTKTGATGLANDTTSVRNALTSSSASYSGTMEVSYAKNSKPVKYKFSIVLKEGSPSTIAFKLADIKTGAVVVSNSSIVSGSIYLNP